MVAACPLTGSVDSINALLEQYPGIAVVAKTITARPIPFTLKFDDNNIHDCGDGSLINSIGLANAGASQWASELRRGLYNTSSSSKPTLVQSIAAPTLDDLKSMLREFESVECISAYEINVSCPNHCGMLAGPDIVSHARDLTDKTLLVKVSYEQALAGFCRQYLDAGASFITAINTMPASFADSADGSIIHHGGLSGSAIRCMALHAVFALAQECGRGKIIGCGGIRTQQHVRDMYAAGACGIQAATAVIQDSMNIDADLLPSPL